MREERRQEIVECSDVESQRDRAVRAEGKQRQVRRKKEKERAQQKQNGEAEK